MKSSRNESQLKFKRPFLMCIETGSKASDMGPAAAIELLHVCIEVARKKLWAHALKLTGSSADADDLCQETFLRLLIWIWNADAPKFFSDRFFRALGLL